MASCNSFYGVRKWIYFGLLKMVFLLSELFEMDGKKKRNRDARFKLRSG